MPRSPGHRLTTGGCRIEQSETLLHQLAAIVPKRALIVGAAMGEKRSGLDLPTRGVRQMERLESAGEAAHQE